MNAVIKKDSLPAQMNEGATLLQVIQNAAQNPQADIEKMERLMAMYERVEAKRAEAEFSADMAQMQSELPSIGERGDAAGRYKFALWEDINTAIKPILSRYGFALTFRTDFTDGIAVTGVLTHRSGHREETTIKLPADASGNKSAVQAVASSVSYGKRYTASALLNLTSHGEDDDAFSAVNATDIKEWADAIKGASSMDELNRIASNLKDRPPQAKALVNVRALWAKRAKELKQ